MRLWDKMKRSFNAAMVAWNEEAWNTESGAWDDYDSRMLRYYLAERYYSNTVFSNLNMVANAIKVRSSLYKFIRTPYNPVQRLVEGYVSSTYGGRLDLERLRFGAIPIVTDNDSIRDSLIDLYRASQMTSKKSLYSRYAAKFGDSFIKVVDSDGFVGLEMIDPHHIVHIDKDMHGNIVYAEIGYESKDIYQPGKYTYGEIITEDSFTLTIDDKEIDHYPNPYGFVPIVHGMFTDIGMKYAMNSFEAQTSKINDINDSASVLIDSIRSAIQPLYHAEKVAKGSLSTNKDEITRDVIRVIYTQGEGTLSPLLAPIDIAGAMELINSLYDELAADLPILSLHKVREMSNVSGVAVQSMFSDAVKRVEEVQSNLDEALTRASAMGIAIMGYRGLAPFNLNYYTDNDFDFHIRSRPVISDELTSLQKLTFLSQLDPESPTARLILEMLDVEDNDIDNVLDNARVSRNNRIEETIISQQANALDEITSFRLTDGDSDSE